MSVTKEKLRQDLAECKAIRPVHAGSTDADFALRERANKVIDLYLNWLDYELSK